MSNWNENTKARAVELYLAFEPTAETTMECVKQTAENLSEEFDAAFTANGTRMILQKATVYVAQGKAVSATPAKAASGTAAPRVSKESSVAELRAAITDMGGDIDDDILSKLTGKAALYFTTIIRKA